MVVTSQWQEYNFGGLPPLLLDLQTSKYPTLCKTTLKNVIHRYLKNIDCASFVMCPLLAPHLPVHFWLFSLQPKTVLMRQTRQTVHAINQPIFLRCLWYYRIGKGFHEVPSTTTVAVLAMGDTTLGDCAIKNCRFIIYGKSILCITLCITLF